MQIDNHPVCERCSRKSPRRLRGRREHRVSQEQAQRNEAKRAARRWLAVVEGSVKCG